MKILRLKEMLLKEVKMKILNKKARLIYSSQVHGTQMFISSDGLSLLSSLFGLSLLLLWLSKLDLFPKRRNFCHQITRFK